MDPNIDPNMGSGIDTQFTKFPLSSHGFDGPDHNSHEDEEFLNAEQSAHASSTFRTYTSIEDDNTQDSSAVAAAAVANMSSIINFNNLESDNDAQKKSKDIPSKGKQKKTNTSLGFLHSLDIEGDRTSRSTTQTSNPKQKLIQDDDSQVAIVVVNPASSEGTGRLGRPRKHAKTNSPSTETSAFDNLDKSIISRFRVDNKPLRGPGSRGGRKTQPTRLKSNSAKRTIQQRLNFGNVKRKRFEVADDIKIIEVSSSDDSEEIIRLDGPDDNSYLKKKENNNNNKSMPENKQQNTKDYEVKKKAPLELIAHQGQETRNITEDPESTGQSLKDDGIVEAIDVDDTESNSSREEKYGEEQVEALNIVFEDYESLKVKGRSTSKRIDQQQNQSSFLSLSSKPIKKRKDHPGPLVGIFNDIYESPLLKHNPDPELNKIALGYKVKPAPYSKDIMAILSFFNKFRKHFGGFPNIGPQDLEVGLKLNPSVKYPVDNANQEQFKKPLYDESRDGGPTEVSNLVNALFIKLLSLALNKTKPLISTQETKAIKELKQVAESWGLPKEWRNDSKIFSKKLLNDDEETEPLDPNHTEWLEPDIFDYGKSEPLDEIPLDNKDFEVKGLSALVPKDRLILLRSLTFWCLSNSRKIKEDILKFLENQDYADRETYYSSRYVKEGESSIINSNANLQMLNQKRKAKPEFEAAYDATSSPIDNGYFLRAIDFFAGEGGFAGRFHLCRTYDHTFGNLIHSGDINSLAKKSTHDLLSFPQPSRFKLYVQDITTMLETKDNVDFLIHHDEKTEGNLIEPWYEVASNADELNSFITFLTQNLEKTKSKNLKNMLNYLSEIAPILEKFEDVLLNLRPPRTTRASRRKPMTNLIEQDARYRKLINYNEISSEDDESDEIEVILGDDDDYQ